MGSLYLYRGGEKKKKNGGEDNVKYIGVRDALKDEGTIEVLRTAKQFMKCSAYSYSHKYNLFKNWNVVIWEQC